MPRRRNGARALKTWTAALRAALRLTGTVAKAGKKKIVLPASNEQSRKISTKATPLSPGQVEIGRFRNVSGTRTYRLYRPATPPSAGTRPPLIVMLHGCAQDAKGFAATTRMSQHADACGCWVLYPEQSSTAHRTRCWHWFEPEHQHRGAGEPAIIAGMVRKIVRQHRLDGRRVFVAGLSAGGALAVILGRTYPDLFRAVGVCAGMPYAAARTSTTALLAMRGRHRPPIDIADMSVKPVRTIVFHGDRDRTVVLQNAEAIVSTAVGAFGPTTMEHEEGIAGGRTYRRVRYRLDTGIVVVESWTLHGVAHAWSGGAPGAYSDPLGPDVSAALMNFFLR